MPSEYPIYPIYTGPWINHSHGIWLGATITLKTRDSAFLIAFLTIVVTIAGKSVWKIVSFITHQRRAANQPHDAIFYQQQAILKNSGSPLDAAWKLFRTSFAWRGHVRTRWWQFWRSRSLFLISLAIILATTFAIASIFSSQVTRAAGTGTGVLIDSVYCGDWSFDSNQKGNSSALVKKLSESVTAAHYATVCYGSGDPSCNGYAQPQIYWNTDQNAPCPFGDDTCLLSSSAAYEMDTGPLDSHDVFGLNAPLTDRITLRKKATCAPLDLEPYMQISNWTVGDGASMDEYLEFFLGPITEYDPNSTAQYDTHARYVGLGYDFEAIVAYAQDPYPGAGTWTPIPEFNRTDADVTLFFFTANSVRYNFPNTDPVFSANIPADESMDDEEPVLYSADSFLTSIGCIDQYQICNPVSPGLDGESAWCTSLSGYNPVLREANDIGLNDYQSATVSAVIGNAEWLSNMFYAVDGRGSAALEAQSTVFDKMQLRRLPNSQWQNEVKDFFAVSLAGLQQALVERAIGPTDVVDSGGAINYPQDSYQEAICRRQIIRNINGYQNFSILGVAIILGVGGTLIILGLVLDKAIGFLQKLFLGKHYGRLAWISDGYLQLQRLAYEGAGYDGWERCASSVPSSRDLSLPARMLGPLDISDIRHPRLVPQTFASSLLTSGGSPHESNFKGFREQTRSVE